MIRGGCSKVILNIEIFDPTSAVIFTSGCGKTRERARKAAVDTDVTNFFIFANKQNQLIQHKCSTFHKHFYCCAKRSSPSIKSIKIKTPKKTRRLILTF